MRVLAENAERHFVGDRLAHDRGAGIEQGLHDPCVTGRRWGEARPVGIAATGRHTGDVDQILDRETKAGERPRRRTRHMRARARHKSFGRGHDAFRSCQVPPGTAANKALV